MAKAPAFQWYPKDCDTDENVRGMDDREFGFYMRCLNHSWLNNGLPSDLAELARVMGRSRNYLEKIWPRVGKCFELVGGRLVNPTQERQRTTVREFVESRRSAANTRWDASKKECTGDARALHTQCSPKGEGEGEPNSSSLELVLKAREEKISFQKDHDTLWTWFKGVYPGELIEIRDAGIFESVIDTFEDIRDMRANLPLWMESRRWKEGYPDSAKNFLTDRIFKERPKVRAPPKVASQPKQDNLTDRTLALIQRRVDEGRKPL